MPCVPAPSELFPGSREQLLIDDQKPKVSLYNYSRRFLQDRRYFKALKDCLRSKAFAPKNIR